MCFAVLTEKTSLLHHANVIRTVHCSVLASFNMNSSVWVVMVSAAASRRLFLDGFWLGMILKGLERERDWCEPPWGWSWSMVETYAVFLWIWFSQFQDSKGSAVISSCQLSARLYTRRSHRICSFCSHSSSNKNFWNLMLDINYLFQTLIALWKLASIQVLLLPIFIIQIWVWAHRKLIIIACTWSLRII